MNLPVCHSNFNDYFLLPFSSSDACLFLWTMKRQKGDWRHWIRNRTFYGSQVGSTNLTHVHCIGGSHKSETMRKESGVSRSKQIYEIVNVTVSIVTFDVYVIVVLRLVMKHMIRKIARSFFVKFNSFNHKSLLCESQ